MKLTYEKRNGHPRIGFAHKNTNSAATARRQGVIERLENQLKEGWKPNKDKECAIGDSALPLNEYDKERINKEIKILKSRI